VKIESIAVGELPRDLMAVGVPVVIGSEGPSLAPGVAGVAASFGVPEELDAGWCGRRGFSGAVGQTLVFHPITLAGPPASTTRGFGDDEPVAAPSIVFVGMGRAAQLDGDAAAEQVRRGVAAYVRAVGEGGTAAFLVPGATAEVVGLAAQAGTEGALLADYRFTVHQTGSAPDGLDRLVLVLPGDLDAAPAAAGIDRGIRVAGAVCLVRDAVNAPPSSMTPVRFVELFSGRLSECPSVTVEVWDEDRCVSERLGGLLAVARGSAEPPRFLRADYHPVDAPADGRRVPHLVWVGKGITFDSGGLSLKTAAGMETMKTDMSGAATVMAALAAAADLAAPVRITALAPLTENMPGGNATKPGDVFRARNGKTIEVLNTDAEGRLVLSDALSIAAELAPDAIIDLATLTGAVVVALGKDVAGLLGNDEALLGSVRSAADRAGESVWPLPMPPDYRRHIDSEVADMKNTGRPGQAGSIAAAVLLAEFVGTVPWAHLDIAGTARSEESAGYLTKGGTGFGVRTLVEMATSERFLAALAVLGPVEESA
jgi:leucyl aminopeptidase